MSDTWKIKTEKCKIQMREIRVLILVLTHISRVILIKNEYEP